MAIIASPSSRDDSYNPWQQSHVRNPCRSCWSTLAPPGCSLENLCAAKVVRGHGIDSSPYSNDVFFLRYCLASDDIPTQTARWVTPGWRTGGERVFAMALQQHWRKLQRQAVTGTTIPSCSAPFSDHLKYLMPSMSLRRRHAGAICPTYIRTWDGWRHRWWGRNRQPTSSCTPKRSITGSPIRDLWPPSSQVHRTANDLAGVKLVGGSAISQALSASSNQTNGASLDNGPTLLLDLPKFVECLGQNCSLFSAKSRRDWSLNRVPQGCGRIWPRWDSPPMVLTYHLCATVGWYLSGRASKS
jgi:hypothetical protein